MQTLDRRSIVSLSIVIIATGCLLIACTVAERPEVTNRAYEFKGDRFRCGEPIGTKLCLSVLLADCKLSILPGTGLPREPEDRAQLTHGGQSMVIDRPDQLKGCVAISSEAEALEYLRFFSSMETVHLFTDKLLEIYPVTAANCVLVCLPNRLWRQLSLPSPQMARIQGGFRITRTVIRPIPNYYEVTVFRAVQDVGPDGEVKEVTLDRLPIPQRDLLLLGFPRYL